MNPKLLIAIVSTLFLSRGCYSFVPTRTPSGIVQRSKTRSFMSAETSFETIKGHLSKRDVSEASTAYLKHEKELLGPAKISCGINIIKLGLYQGKPKIACDVLMKLMESFPNTKEESDDLWTNSIVASVMKKMQEDTSSWPTPEKLEEALKKLETASQEANWCVAY
eukprot:CAMPEP_0118688156 /NCGR_PEP_ID=MMETSP0800-20121206/8767_1 /TAXON_ID=210618 ORGANISM="Striatella unipunctata, Strain CCMP2910" /NCGR_SAMPLE_ID=MMETSP0800 /ASSEMBLY_ACC=CAM_ASM_000638 /LENGTH=165 /DNA_ID=CAMNT_0006585391 /DNA_START=40 /DNA_END=537 /DNA_ORIENTATION=+